MSDDTIDYGFGFKPRRLTSVEREIEEKWDTDRGRVHQLVADWIAYQFYLRNSALFDSIRGSENSPEFLEYKQSEAALIEKGLARLTRCFRRDCSPYVGVEEMRNFLIEEKLWVESDDKYLEELHRFRPILH